MIYKAIATHKNQHIKTIIDNNPINAINRLEVYMKKKGRRNYDTLLKTQTENQKARS